MPNYILNLAFAKNENWTRVLCVLALVLALWSFPNVLNHAVWPKGCGFDSEGFCVTFRTEVLI